MACNYEYKCLIYFYVLCLSANTAYTANHPVGTINWVKIIIGLSIDIINDRDFEQLTSITRDLHRIHYCLLTVRTHTSGRNLVNIRR